MSTKKKGFTPLDEARSNCLFHLTGFTLIEVIIAIILSAIALFGIETLIVESFKDWRAGKEIVELQRDLDVASYKIKGILEEADSFTILNEGAKISAGYKTDWLKEFYASGTNLIYKSSSESPEETIINTLQSILFTNSSNHIVRVDLNVQKGARQLNSSFLVYLRNPGGG